MYIINTYRDVVCSLHLHVPVGTLLLGLVAAKEEYDRSNAEHQEALHDGWERV